MDRKDVDPKYTAFAEAGMVYAGSLPSGYVKIAIENGHLMPFIVDLPIKNGDFP